ncbi:hypothetical protein [Natronoglycomyces albus]|uniref:Uncharacterized protein n=1 Tax=Natronoglycomyces albus TaxID=2811108 RepID=A0A895XMY1_9ACTN|nr:hypothetical protein [Natronoglycomyces albus]QSB04395.1 hypothetical protein JQS30_11395 [Natronoglycomyces albus]
MATTVLVFLLSIVAISGLGIYTVWAMFQDFVPAAVAYGLEDGSDRTMEYFFYSLPMPIILFGLISALGLARRWFWIRIFTPIWIGLLIVPITFGIGFGFVLIDEAYESNFPPFMLFTLIMLATMPLLMLLTFVMMFAPGVRRWAISKTKRAQLTMAQPAMPGPPSQPGLTYQHQPPGGYPPPK